MIYDKIEFESVWDEWIKGNEEHISTYIHSKHLPILTTNYFLSNAQIVKTVPTHKGTWGLVHATLQMFQEALKDTSNTHCILISGSCIPVKSAKYVFDFLQKDVRSFIHELTCHKIAKYFVYIRLPKKTIENRHVGIHSQWILLNRTHIELLVKDSEIIKGIFEKLSFPDEKWALTYLNYLGLSSEVCTDILTTYCNWKERDGTSPKTYLEISEKEIGELLEGPSLFARKFVGNTIVSGKNILLSDYLEAHRH